SHLGHNLNNMVASLSDMTSKVTESSNSMLVTVEQVRAAVSAQSSGLAQQAASINETTTTLEQIRATSQQTLDKASVLREISDRARAEGDEGLSVVETAVASMQDIHHSMEGISRQIIELNEQVQQIGEITTTVSDLAQQSKMLALNASIEAAKAGDAGRGFAVVADEVKDMAEQSRQATAQVHGILDEVRNASARTVRAVEEGNKSANLGATQAEQAGSVLRDLNKVIHDTAQASQQIMAAVRQEATGIDQIRVAMDDINMVTSQFVSATNQTESAADHLTDYTTSLQHMVKRFKVENYHFDFELARAMHRTWVMRLEGFLDGRETLTEEQAVSHQHCDLGRWYDSVGMEKYGDVPEMGLLEKPHRELHQLIHNAVSAHNRGDTCNKDEVIKQVKKLSIRVIELLQTIELKVKSHGQTGREE
ncbi:MAG: hypothetical protein HN344_09535, partial [Gammaproteobacteria bacterium]|nr:hypothetical protein [Gammaproteobacteria bacterium]